MDEPRLFGRRLARLCRDDRPELATACLRKPSRAAARLWSSRRFRGGKKTFAVVAGVRYTKAREELGKDEFDRIAGHIRASWKAWQGDDSLHEMAFGEPTDGN
jgi:hypothetical protein